jgi:cytochrome P450
MRLIAGNTELGVQPLPNVTIADEATNILYAGTDTSATTIRYMLP